jgi:adenylate cyclase class IV
MLRLRISGQKPSGQIVAVSEPLKLRALLTAALGLLAEVRKQRIFLRRANVRLHLDQVADRGAFGEIEAILQPGDDPAAFEVKSQRSWRRSKFPLSGVSESYFELSR